jgi:hypothetical protein
MSRHVSPGIQEGMAWLVSAIHGVAVSTPRKSEPKEVGSDASTVASDGEITP